MVGDKRRILVTGHPGVGKTTLIRQVARDLAHLRPVGFYTTEVREAGVRRGFDWVSLDGRRGRLAHVELRSPHRVGKYGVDVAGFEQFLDDVRWSNARLVVIDEIGKMECVSESFQLLVRRLLDSDTPLLATVASTGGGLIGDVKRRPDFRLIKLTRRNRDSLAAEILSLFA